MSEPPSKQLTDLTDLAMATLFDYLPLVDLQHIDEVHGGDGGGWRQLKIDALHRRPALVIGRQQADLPLIEVVARYQGCSFELLRFVWEDEEEAEEAAVEKNEAANPANQNYQNKDSLLRRRRSSLLFHHTNTLYTGATAYLGPRTYALISHHYASHSLTSLSVVLPRRGRVSELVELALLLEHPALRRQLRQLTVLFWGDRGGGKRQAAGEDFRDAFRAVFTALNQLGGLERLTLNLRLITPARLSHRRQWLELLQPRVHPRNPRNNWPLRAHQLPFVRHLNRPLPPPPAPFLMNRPPPPPAERLPFRNALENIEELNRELRENLQVLRRLHRQYVQLRQEALPRGEVQDQDQEEEEEEVEELPPPKLPPFHLSAELLRRLRHLSVRTWGFGGGEEEGEEGEEREPQRIGSILSGVHLQNQQGPLGATDQWDDFAALRLRYFPPPPPLPVAEANSSLQRPPPPPPPSRLEELYIGNSILSLAMALGENDGPPGGGGEEEEDDAEDDREERGQEEEEEEEEVEEREEMDAALAQVVQREEEELRRRERRQQRNAVEWAERRWVAQGGQLLAQQQQRPPPPSFAQHFAGLMMIEEDRLAGATRELSLNAAPLTGADVQSGRLERFALRYAHLQRLSVTLSPLLPVEALVRALAPTCTRLAHLAIAVNYGWRRRNGPGQGGRGGDLVAPVEAARQEQPEQPEQEIEQPPLSVMTCVKALR